MLRAARKLAGLTRQSAAAAAGTSVSHLGRLESGACRPSAALAERLADALGLAGEERAVLLAGAANPLTHPWRRSYSPNGPYPQGLAPVAPPIPTRAIRVPAGP